MRNPEPSGVVRVCREERIRVAEVVRSGDGSVERGRAKGSVKGSGDVGE